MAADARESSRPSANAVPPNRATTNDGFMRAMIYEGRNLSAIGEADPKIIYSPD